MVRGLALFALASLAAGFSNVNENVNFQFIPATQTTPGGYFDVCPINAYVERNPAKGPMNVTECGCPAGYTLRPTARSEGIASQSAPNIGGGLQCVPNNALTCVDCEYYVRDTAANKINTLWSHVLSSAMIEDTNDFEANCNPTNPAVLDTSVCQLCSKTGWAPNKGLRHTCVYRSSLLTSSAAKLPADSVESNSGTDAQYFGKGRRGRDTFPRFTTLYTESMDASFDRYSDQLPKGRVKAIHNHGVVTKVEYNAIKTAEGVDQLTKTKKQFSGFFESGSDNCLLRMSISHPINVTCACTPEEINGGTCGCRNNGFLASTALKCTRNGTYSANILGLQDARGQYDNLNFFHTQLKNWVPGYTPNIPSFGGVGPNAERFGTSTDDPLRMSLDQFSVAGEDGKEDIAGISQPDIVYWVPNGCMAGAKNPTTGEYAEAGGCKPYDPFDESQDFATTQNHYSKIMKNEKLANHSPRAYDFRDDLMAIPQNTIIYDLYAPGEGTGTSTSGTNNPCYCTTIGMTDVPDDGLGPVGTREQPQGDSKYWTPDPNFNARFGTFSDGSPRGLYRWGNTIALSGTRQPCPVILQKNSSFGCPVDKFPFVKIGQMVSKSPVVMSGWADTQLFFQHGRYGKKENRVCRFSEAIPNNNKGVANPARFGHDHHLACVAGVSCPAGSTELPVSAAALLPANHPAVSGDEVVGCPFANAFNKQTAAAKLAGEAYPRPFPVYSPKCFTKCPPNSYALRAHPTSFTHCKCFDGFVPKTRASVACGSTTAPGVIGVCEASGPYTPYNPVGLEGFWGVEVSVPSGSLDASVAFWKKLGFVEQGARTTRTLPKQGGTSTTLTTQLLKLATGTAAPTQTATAIMIELAEQADSLAPTGVSYYGYEMVTFAVRNADSALEALKAAVPATCSTATGAMNKMCTTATVQAYDGASGSDPQGYRYFDFHDNNGNKFRVAEDLFGELLGVGVKAPTNSASSFWSNPIPTQPILTQVKASGANPLGLGGIRAVHELVAETSAAQIWNQDTLNMTLWQFEKPSLYGLAENFNDCYQNAQKRADISDAECSAIARLFPQATVGLGQMRMIYRYCNTDASGECSAGFVNSVARKGSFIRPTPPYHNAYHGISQVTFQVSNLQRSMQALASKGIELIAPSALDGNSYRSVMFATNGKAFVKLVEPTSEAALATVPPTPGYSTPSAGDGSGGGASSSTGTGKQPAAGATTAAPASAADCDSCSGYRSATIALAVIIVCGAVGALAVRHAYGTGSQQGFKKHADSTPKGRDGRSESSVEMRSNPGGPDNA